MNNKLFTALIISSLISACGAPVKSSEDVAYMFNGSQTLSLDDKLQNVCGALNGDNGLPDLSKLAVSLGDCVEAGTVSVNYKAAQSFPLVGRHSGEDITKKLEKSIHFSTRTQVWLNIGLLDAAGKLMNGMGTMSPDNNPFTSGDTTNQEGPLQVKVDVDQPKMDLASKTGAGSISIKTKGFVKIAADMKIQFGLVENAIAVSIHTTDFKDYQESLVRSMHILILVVPHAQDIYLDAFIDIKVNRTETGDGLIKGLAEALFGTIMKGMVATMLGDKDNSLIPSQDSSSDDDDVVVAEVD